MSLVTDPKTFGRVAVVMGGDSSERDVSLDGGRCVLDGLLSSGVNAFAIDGVTALIEQIRAGTVDRVFNLLHGRGGEDGVLQGLLAALAVPVTGSSVLGSALSMDKARSKAIWREQGLPTADYRVAHRGDDLPALAEQLGYPLFVKPVSEGSSVGGGRADAARQLKHAAAAAFEHEEQILLETLIDGEELTVAILQGEALPAIRIEPGHEFYDYEAKYADVGTRYHCPAGLSAELEQHLRTMALQAFAAVACAGWGRADFMRDRATGQCYLMEVNTTPGMTSHSLVPMAAAEVGMSFAQLVWRVLETSFQETSNGELR